MTDIDTAELGKAIIESPAEAVIYANAEGTIQFWNNGAERLFGFTPEEARGQSLDIIIPPKIREAHWHGFHRVMETGEGHYQAGDLLAVPGIRKDGERVSLEFTVVPLHDATGRISGIAAVLRDVTRRWEEMRAHKARIRAIEQTG